MIAKNTVKVKQKERARAYLALARFLVVLKY
jgi:hypothetical protein